MRRDDRARVVRRRSGEAATLGAAVGRARQVGTPKSGRLRYLPLTERLTATLAEHRHLRSKRVLCQEDGKIKTGGEAGIRTLDTAFGPYNGLANRRLQPLGHLTATRMLSINDIAGYAKPLARGTVPETVPARDRAAASIRANGDLTASRKRHRFFSEPSIPAPRWRSRICSPELANALTGDHRDWRGAAARSVDGRRPRSVQRSSEPCQRNPNRGALKGRHHKQNPPVSATPRQ
jgi:hypothetical protein